MGGLMKGFCTLARVLVVLCCFTLLVAALVACAGAGTADSETAAGGGTASEEISAETVPEDGVALEEQPPQSGVPLVWDEDLSLYLLPSPRKSGEVSVEEALAGRRSQRVFTDEPLTALQLSQMMWAANGVSSTSGQRTLRTAPSAGATFPLTIYAVVGNVEGLQPGVYRYAVYAHGLQPVSDSDVRAHLRSAALGQSMVENAPLTIAIAADFSKTTDRYGERGIMYTHMEVGHVGQNIYLQAEALGLGTCAIGAFTDDRVGNVLQLPANEVPLYLMPVGHYR